jgi:hypothetical protein
MGPMFFGSRRDRRLTPPFLPSILNATKRSKRGHGRPTGPESPPLEGNLSEIYKGLDYDGAQQKNGGAMAA